jgi:hypothetical protein
MAPGRNSDPLPSGSGDKEQVTAADSAVYSNMPNNRTMPVGAAAFHPMMFNQAAFNNPALFAALTGQQYGSPLMTEPPPAPQQQQQVYVMYPPTENINNNNSINMNNNGMMMAYSNYSSNNNNYYYSQASSSVSNQANNTGNGIESSTIASTTISSGPVPEMQQSNPAAAVSLVPIGNMNNNTNDNTNTSNNNNYNYNPILVPLTLGNAPAQQHPTAYPFFFDSSSSTSSMNPLQFMPQVMPYPIVPQPFVQPQTFGGQPIFATVPLSGNAVTPLVLDRSAMAAAASIPWNTTAPPLLHTPPPPPHLVVGTLGGGGGMGGMGAGAGIATLATPPPTMMMSSAADANFPDWDKEGIVQDRPPVPIAMPFDARCLSSYQSLIREQIEVFQAIPADVEANAQGRNRPVVLGQVGIRCRHCARAAPRQRKSGSVYYPSKVRMYVRPCKNVCCGWIRVLGVVWVRKGQKKVKTTRMGYSCVYCDCLFLFGTGWLVLSSFYFIRMHVPACGSLPNGTKHGHQAFNIEMSVCSTIGTRPIVRLKRQESRRRCRSTVLV